jgi:hypothetical protein
VRHARAVHQRVAALDVVAFLHRDVLALRHQVLARGRLLVAHLLGHHQDAALRLVVLAELHAAVDLADDRMVLRAPRLEQLRHARQAAGDVARLGRFARHAREHVAGGDLRLPFSIERMVPGVRK